MLRYKQLITVLPQHSDEVVALNKFWKFTKCQYYSCIKSYYVITLLGRKVIVHQTASFKVMHLDFKSILPLHVDCLIEINNSLGLSNLDLF